MAGDWIPVRKELGTSPEVLYIQTKTGVSIAETVWSLIKLWSWFDSESVDGFIVHATSAMCPHVCGQTIDFWSAVIDTGWLSESKRNGVTGLEIPNPERYLSKSAKRRLLDTKNKRKRRNPQNVRKVADKKRTTEENRIEEDIGNKSTYSHSQKRAKRVRENAEKGAPKAGESAAPEPVPKEPKVRTVLYEIFQREFQAKYGAAFIPKDADFVQLSRLLWDRTEAWVAERWETAVKNYFASPQKTHTLADLSVNFVTFQIQVIDRFNKPANGNGHKAEETQSAKRLRETSERWAREDATANGGDNREIAALPGSTGVG